jgi:hypothetical protein
MFVQLNGNLALSLIKRCAKGVWTYSSAILYPRHQMEVNVTLGKSPPVPIGWAEWARSLFSSVAVYMLYAICYSIAIVVMTA